MGHAVDPVNTLHALMTQIHAEHILAVNEIIDVVVVDVYLVLFRHKGQFVGADGEGVDLHRPNHLILRANPLPELGHGLIVDAAVAHNQLFQVGEVFYFGFHCFGGFHRHAGEVQLGDGAVIYGSEDFLFPGDGHIGIGICKSQQFLRCHGGLGEVKGFQLRQVLQHFQKFLPISVGEGKSGGVLGIGSAVQSDLI